MTKAYQNDATDGNMLLLEQKAMAGDYRAIALIEAYAKAVTLKCWYAYLMYDPTCVALAIGLFISTILIVKLQNARYREIGLLSALGFGKRQIRAMIVFENILLSCSAATLNALFIVIAYFISSVFQLGLIITVPQIILSILSTGVVVTLISVIASYKLLHTEPAIALQK